jgi:hypothetical protein
VLLAWGWRTAILSGSCTFGFIAPILAVVTVQQEWATGSLMMILFALRALSADCYRRQFHGHGEKTDRKPRLAGCRQLVSKGVPVWLSV